MLRKALDTLPHTLDQTYERILTNIREEDCVYAMRILQWLTFSARPLSVQEVAHVAAIDSERDPAFDRDEVLVDPLEVLEICSSLVTITNKAEDDQVPTQRIVTLAHYSVQEYLVSDRIKNGPAEQYSMQEVKCHKAIAKGSLGYLNQFQFRTSISERFLTQFALAHYSAEFWMKHLHKTGDEMEDVSQLAMGLFSAENPAYLTWVRLGNPNARFWAPGFGQNPEKVAEPLYYGALLGSSTITTLLLDRGVDVNASGGQFGNALQAASAGGHKTVVNLLIHAGAEVNASGGQFGNALEAASAGGHDHVARALLSAGALVDMQGGIHGNALHAALVGGHEAVVQLLLRTGASVGLNIRLPGAIYHALNSARCTPAVVTMLQHHGALSMADDDNMTPLHYCVKFNRRTIAKQLIDAGVSVDSRARRRVSLSKSNTSDSGQLDIIVPDPSLAEIGFTPLHFAAFFGNVTMARFLLEHGADPNAVSEYGETPLHLTLCPTLLGLTIKDAWTDSFNTFEQRLYLQKHHTDGMDIVESEITRIRQDLFDALLADSRTTFTKANDRGEGYLHYLQYQRPESVHMTQKLICRGVDPLRSDSRRRTPIHLASRAGDHASIKILLEAGAKVASTDDWGLNPLHYAALSGSHETLMMLLGTTEAKAVGLIASRDNMGQNVLHYVLSAADRVPCVEIVQWLLDQGADSSELDCSGDSPLVKYIKTSRARPHRGICGLLLRAGDNRLFVNTYGQTLGHLWAFRSDFAYDELEFLFWHGVKLEQRDCGQRNILHYAACYGKFDGAMLWSVKNSIGIRTDVKDIDGLTVEQFAKAQAGRTQTAVTEAEVKRNAEIRAAREREKEDEKRRAEEVERIRAEHERERAEFVRKLERELAENPWERAERARERARKRAEDNAKHSSTKEENMITRARLLDHDARLRALDESRNQARTGDKSVVPGDDSVSEANATAGGGS